MNFPRFLIILGTVFLLTYISCLTSSDPDDPPPPNIKGKWRTYYEDTVNTEIVDKIIEMSDTHIVGIKKMFLQIRMS